MATKLWTKLHSGSHGPSCNKGGDKKLGIAYCLVASCYTSNNVPGMRHSALSNANTTHSFFDKTKPGLVNKFAAATNDPMHSVDVELFNGNEVSYHI